MQKSTDSYLDTNYGHLYYFFLSKFVLERLKNKAKIAAHVEHNSHCKIFNEVSEPLKHEDTNDELIEMPIYMNNCLNIKMQNTDSYCITLKYLRL